jgi:hypothetical protein
LEGQARTSRIANIKKSAPETGPRCVNGLAVQKSGANVSLGSAGHRILGELTDPLAQLRILQPQHARAALCDDTALPLGVSFLLRS